ncbi:hypothetical protein BH11ARM2_BH11ARM2_00410 [soil metagenome]
MKWIVTVSLLWLACVVFAETKVVSGHLTLAESGRITIDGRTEAKPNGKTRYWQDRKPVTAMLPVGTPVVARIADDGTLRELADDATYVWLASIRKDPQEAAFVVAENGRMRFSLARGGEFSYRRTPTSKVEPTEPAPGARLWVTGRLMANGDTRLTLATTKQADPPRRKAETTSRPLPASGHIEVELVAHNPAGASLLVRYEGRLYTMLYGPSTRFTADGERVTPAALEAGMDLDVHSRTDRFGRILLARVELL